PRPSREELREDARAVVSAHCGACHTGSLATAKPEALAVYDLEQPEWAALLSEAQLADAVSRLTNDGTTEADRGRFERYVAAERAERAAAPACPPDDVLEALHAAAYRLEHEGTRDGIAAARAAVRAPLDDTTRGLLARLSRAPGDGVAV